MPDLDKAVRVICGHAYDAPLARKGALKIAQALSDAGLLIPEGFVAVPREPTEAMIEAYFETCRRFGFNAHINATAAWEAMIQAQGERG